MTEISQSFGTTRVLHDVDISVQPGEIHALVGQNGAGKSTLMKILGGQHPEHDGRVAINGLDVHLRSPRDALRQGIALIHQELSLIPTLSVAENILLGMEPGVVGFSARRTAQEAARTTARVPMLAELPLDLPAGDLSTGFQQRIEIAKALARDVSTIVFDEPTARLSGPEREDLRRLLLELAADGIAVIYISHYLEEVFDSCHCVTVLRNGRVVASGPVTDFTVASMTRLMLGEDLADDERDRSAAPATEHPAEPAVQLDGVTGAVLRGVDLVVRPGEIVGLAGLVGSGRSRVARTIAGVEPLTGGTLTVFGKHRTWTGPRQALGEGVVLIPENRKTEGLVGTASADRNMVLLALDTGLARWGVVRHREARRTIDDQFTRLQIRPAEPDRIVDQFSGGNQQKILLARALLAAPRVLVVDQPTIGVDVGTKAQIHQVLRRTAAEGAAILVITDDIGEMLALADRVYVMHAGRVTVELARSEIDHDGLVDAIARP